MRVFTDNKTKMQYVEISTRAPAKVQMYFKSLALATGKTQKTMLFEAAERFLQERPWQQGLAWRQTSKATVTEKDVIGQKEAAGWMQVNMRLPAEIGKAFIRLSVEQNVSLPSLTYTLLYWWTWWVFPPASERVRRSAKRPLPI